MSGLEHVTILNPTEMIVCSECGRGHFAESNEVHPTAGTIYHCTWGGCSSEGVTLPDLQFDEGEELQFVRTEAGLCLGWRNTLE